jgi:DNA-binding transcriptional LysR family regulator
MVVTAGSFIAAAERLHVSQSTVSARVRALEEDLGSQLFVRNRAGAVLTAAGRQFHRHAATLVRTVEAARHDMGVPTGFRQSLAIGARFALWPQLLLGWMRRFRDEAPDTAVRAQVGFEDDLMLGLVEGNLHIALMYTPQSRAGLEVEPLLEERLVLVGTEPDLPPRPGPGYVFVDWGEAFRSGHSVAFPEFAGAAITASIGWQGLEYILTNGGYGYFPLRLVREGIAAGSLHRLAAPEFPMPAYLVYPRDRDRDLLDPALAGIRTAAARIADVA